ncbi:glycosyltransferase family 4 protein [Thiothrix unzii]|uniref:Glycosyltransferase family 4 protein n=1 Tax=Thiothrix unzii TaxID=111769 RepID=A0A975F9H8_9GAMM|nr:glycosyltransferase family 4 protein [Thiothrix unzii]QTR53483.1 glycosyltransferase family 4 protein [Thiothrix unzii]
MASKPTLLVTTSTFPRWKGDSEPRFVYDLSRRLTETFNVVVLAPHAAGAKVDEMWDGMQVYRYRYAPTAWETLAYNGGISANLKQNRWNTLLLPLFFIGQWWALRKLLKTYPVDTLHAHWLIPQGLVAALALWGKTTKPTLICTSHGGDLFGLQDAISTRLKRWVVQRCQAVTVVSHAMLAPIQALAGANPPPVSVIPMGTDLQQTFIPNPQVSRAANQLLFVGRLVEKKGLPYLLHALQQLLPTHPDLQLVVAGSGTALVDLMQLSETLGISQHVTFLGRLEHSSLVRLYQTSTLAVFPFIQAADGDMEGLGLVMVEAMGCGCPVIASDLPAVRDVIRHAETGLLVEANNSNLLAGSIKALLNEPERGKQYSRNALYQTVHQFDWANSIQSYTLLLTSSTGR